MGFRGKLSCSLLGALSASAVLLASGASANSYCVNEPACVSAGGTQEGATGAAVQKALEAAESHANSGGADQVVIGAGSYSRAEAYSYGGDPVLVRGAGPAATILTRTAVEAANVVIFDSAGSTLKDLEIEAPAAKDVTGLGLNGGTVEDVAIAGTKAGTSSEGLKLNAGTFANGTIAMSTAPGSTTTGVSQFGGEVVGSSIAAEYGIQASGATTVRGSRISASAYGVLSFSSTPTVEDTLIDLGGKNAFGIFLVANSGTAKGTFRQLTIVNGGESSRGLLISAENKHAATATLNNSVIVGVEEPLVVTSENVAGNSSSLTSSYSSFESAKDAVGSFGTVFNEHAVTAAPGFVSPLLGGFRSGDWRLLPTSALLDAGAPGGLGGGEDTLDAAGNPRIVNARRDVGAFEYQRRPPVISAATAIPATASVGVQIAFAGTASPQEAGDTIASYTWTFDDGGSAQGASATHAFAAPGTHTATLTVADVLGITAQATTTVTVSALAATQVPGPAPIVHGGSTLPALTVVALARLSLSPSAFTAAASGGSTIHGKRGGALIDYELREPAKVVFAVERVLRGVKSAKACVAPRRGMHGKSCSRRLKLRGSFSAAGVAGKNTLRFSGRLGGKTLAPGSYVLVASAPGGALRAPFSIAR